MFAHGDKSLTTENVLKMLDSYQLFKAYCSNFTEINKKFSSELREDKNPSCSIIFWNGDLLYKDFGDKSYRVFDYIAKKYNLKHHQVLQKINCDFGLGLGHSSSPQTTSLVIPEKSPVDLTDKKHSGTIIEVQKRDWTKLDREYWASYNIPVEILEEHDIFSIEGYRITNEKMQNAYFRVNPYMLAYSIDYYWNENVFRRKLYFPQSKTCRFLSNVDSTIVQGWKKLPKTGGNILFITKSYKDILIFDLLDYYAVAPNNESAFIPERVMEKLKSRWKNIYVWFDNDEGGVKGGETFSHKFGLKMTHNPLGEPKDPSDYVKKYNLTKFNELITTFLQENG